VNEVFTKLLTAFSSDGTIHRIVSNIAILKAYQDRLKYRYNSLSND